MKKSKIQNLKLKKLNITKLDNFSAIKGGTVGASGSPNCDHIDEDTISGLECRSIAGTCRFCLIFPRR